MLNRNEAPAKRTHAWATDPALQGPSSRQANAHRTRSRVGERHPQSVKPFRQHRSGGRTQHSSVAAFVAKRGAAARLTWPGRVGFALEATVARRLAIGSINARCSRRAS